HTEDDIMLSDKIRELRSMRGLSLEQLANMVGSTKSYIWELEKKPEIKPSAELVSKLAQALNVTMDSLMDESKENDRDIVFFREYKNLSEETKVQLMSILQAIK
ncbi:helix-turn-helix domain-containing protein, partial [Escherichia coli]